MLKLWTIGLFLLTSCSSQYTTQTSLSTSDNCTQVVNAKLDLNSANEDLRNNLDPDKIPELEMKVKQNENRLNSLMASCSATHKNNVRHEQKSKLRSNDSDFTPY